MISNATLGLDLETLVDLTPEDARRMNSGYKSLSSALPPAHGGPVSSALPPKPKHKKHPAHHAVSSAKPF